MGNRGISSIDKYRVYYVTVINTQSYGPFENMEIIG